MGDAIQLLLTVALGFVLGVIVLIGGTFLLVRWWIKRKINDIAEQVTKGLGGEDGDLFDALPMTVAPPRVHPRPREGLSWRHGEAVEGASRAFLARGFVAVGDYQIPELPVQMRAFLDPSNRYYAIVYEHAMLDAPFIDLHGRLTNDGTLTVTSAPHGEEIGIRPVSVKFYEKNAAPEVLIARMERELSSREVVPLTAEGFVAEFERAYAQGMDYQFSRGGPTMDEIRRGAQMRGETVDEAVVRATYRAQREQNALLIEQLVREKFVEQSGLSASEWETVRDDLVIVHDQQTADGLLAKLWHVSPPDDEANETDFEARERELKARVREGTPREAFARLMQELPTPRRPRLLGHVPEPVPADVYATASG